MVVGAVNESARNDVSLPFSDPGSSVSTVFPVDKKITILTMLSAAPDALRLVS
jgi:hypothetical protein